MKCKVCSTAENIKVSTTNFYEYRGVTKSEQVEMTKNIHKR